MRQYLYAVLLLAGLSAGAGILATAASAAEPGPPPGTLQEQIDQLRGAMPAQPVAMTQVAYNFDNLWFAVKARNWTLASYYLSETRVRIRWAMRVQPIRKIDGQDMELTPIATALENAQLAAIAAAITAKNVSQFQSAYRETLTACHACHVAIQKPYLALRIPQRPAEGMIDFKPQSGP